MSFLHLLVFSVHITNSTVSACREAVNKWKACMDHQKYQVDLAECVEYDRQQSAWIPFHSGSLLVQLTYFALA